MASDLISMYLKHMDVRKRKGILRRTKTHGCEEKKENFKENSPLSCKSS